MICEHDISIRKVYTADYLYINEHKKCIDPITILVACEHPYTAVRYSTEPSEHAYL